GPVDLLVGGGIDVLLHHRHVLVAVLGRAVAPERGRDLLGLALVSLLDLHDDVHAVGDRGHEDVADARDAGRAEDVPGDGRALDGGHDAVLAVGAGERALETAAEDRIAPAGDAGDLHGRARRGDVGDVAGELPERSFHLVGRRVVADDPLDHDLGRGGHLEVDRLAAHQLGGLAPIATHDVPFTDAGGDGR